MFFSLLSVYSVSSPLWLKLLLNLCPIKNRLQYAMKYYIDARTFYYLKKGKSFSVLVTITPPSNHGSKAITSFSIPALDTFSNLNYKIKQFVNKFYTLNKCWPKTIEVELLYETVSE